MGDADPQGRQPADGAVGVQHRERSPGAPPPWDPGKEDQHCRVGPSDLLQERSGRGADQAVGCLRWAKDLRSLLCDREGLQLFEAFLEQEGADKGSLSFWFACNGFRSCHDPAVKQQYMRSIYRHYIRNNMVELSAPVRNEIAERLRDGVADAAVFDRAQREFESFLERTAYPKFLQSDLYIEQVERTHARLSSPATGASAAPPDVTRCAATDNSGEGRQARTAAGSDDSSTPLMLPSQGLEILPTLREDEELAPGWPPPAAALTRRNVRQLHRYSDLLPRLSKAVVAVSSNAVVDTPKCGGGVPNPYHVRNSCFVPPSAQDSELHSLSSGAYTDDANTEVDSIPPLKEKMSQRASQGAAIRKNANINRDSLGEHVIIPRTQLDHPYSLAEKHPAQFAASIIEKLRAVKRQADSGDRLHRAQQEDFPVGGGCSGSSVASGNNLRMAAGATGPLSSSSAALPGPPMPMTTDSAEKFVGLGGEEVSSQSILDEHVSRVFDSPQAQTPQRSTSPRRRAAVPTSPYAVLGHQPRHRKERDTCSSDSGAVRDFSPEGDSGSHGARRRSQGGPGAGGGGGGVPPSSRVLRGVQPSDSGVDSGTSVVYEPLPCTQGAAERVNTWILNHKAPEYPLWTPDSERDSRGHKKSTTSGTSSRSKQNSTGPSRSRPCTAASGCGSASSSGWGPSDMGVFQTSQQPPDTMTQLVEARRRLEVNYTAAQQAAKPKKWNKGSSRVPPSGLVPGACLGQQGVVNTGCCAGMPGGIPAQHPRPPSPPAEATVIGYCYSGETVPYRTKLAGRDITLRQFKALLSKKGNYRYYFRRSCHEFGTDVVIEEISDDNEVLPLWEGKIFATVEPLD